MQATPTYNENELLARIAQDDQQAFSLLVDQYTTPIYTHLMIYMKDGNRAEEVTQDIFMVIWRNRGKLVAMENFAGYLYVITRNRVKKEIRQKVLATDQPPEDMLHTLLSYSGSTLEYKELQEVILKGIDQLPPKRREVFTLSRLEGLPHNEIARRLDISKNTIKQHIKEALVFLRGYLRNVLGEVLAFLVCAWLSGF